MTDDLSAANGCSSARAGDWGAASLSPSPRPAPSGRGRPDRSALTELAATNPNIRPEVADAADQAEAWNLLDHYDPEVVILITGANPVMRPLQRQTWETFSVNWNTDVKIAFTWLREALLSRCPRQQGRGGEQRSGFNGSPAGGGYAGSKPPSGSSPDTPKRSPTAPDSTLPSPR